MKKKYLIPVLFSIIVIFASCRKASIVGVENCLDRIDKVNETLQTYVADPSVDNCKNYVKALRSYIKSDACFGNIFFDAYKTELDDLEDKCN